MPSLRISAILPHLQVFGGVRRFIELGNEFTRRGYSYTVYVPEKEKEKGLKVYGWRYDGHLASINKIPGRSDLFLLGHPRPPCTKVLSRIERPVYIYILAGGDFLADYKRLEGKYPFVVNNRSLKKHFKRARVIEGGVNTEYWYPKKVKVLYHGSKGQGVEEQLRDIPWIELIPLKGLSDKRLREAYRSADYFISWEKRKGWANMAAEAFACGCPVISNGINTEPFNDRVIQVHDLRSFFVDPFHELNWKAVVDKWLKLFVEDGLLDRREIERR